MSTQLLQIDTEDDDAVTTETFLQHGVTTPISSNRSQSDDHGRYERDSSGGLGAFFTSTSAINSVYLSIGCVGMLGNACAVTVIALNRHFRRKMTNVYVLNQSVLDFLSSFFLAATSFPLPVPPLTDNDDHHPPAAALGNFICRFWETKYPLWAMLVASTYNLVVITLERYLEVVHPIRHKVTFTRRKGYASMASCWLLGLVWQTYFFPTSAMVPPEGECVVYSIWPSEVLRNVFGVANVAVQFIVPFLIIIYVYVRILYVINNRIDVTSGREGSGGRSHAGPAERTTSRTNDRWRGARRNTVKTMALVAAAFVLCWSQNQIYYLMMNVGYPEDFGSVYYHFTVVCVFANSCINPFIYAAKYREFQVAARAVLSRCVPWVQPPASRWSSSSSAGGATGNEPSRTTA